MSLPAPSTNQAYCDVSALYAGNVNAPLAWVLDGVKDDARGDVPALAFLLRHSSRRDTFLFDLGTRKDWHNLPPASLKYAIEHLEFRIDVREDVVDALAKGGLKPADIDYVCYSHLHLDHTGDAAPFTKATFLVGEAARPLVENGYPKNPDATISADVLPAGRSTYFDPANWPPLGPFPHALDFYGDGSLYVVDAGAGHFPGHLNLLARTSPDGGWIFLAGDSAHHWALITGEGKIARTDRFGCAHVDVAASEEHISRIRTLVEENPRVRVILAHDEPWYSQNKGGPAFLPGKIESL
ncbi:beta-lactamase-like protein [Trametes punicea]|nr:beta-lactamase-like protein [Trametes punicea]